MQREVKITGSVENKISDLLGGVRSAISHRGVLSLEKVKEEFNPFHPETGFQILSEAARKESFER